MGVSIGGKYVLWKVCPVESMSFGKYVLWKVCPVESMSCGKYVLWKVCPLENMSCGKYVLWKVCPVESMSFGKYVLWKVCPVESMSFGKYVLWKVCGPQVEESTVGQGILDLKDINGFICPVKYKNTVGSRFTTGLHSQIFVCKSNRCKTSSI
jgi:hypothetical protein